MQHMADQQVETAPSEVPVARPGGRPDRSAGRAAFIAEPIRAGGGDEPNPDAPSAKADAKPVVKVEEPKDVEHTDDTDDEDPPLEEPKPDDKEAKPDAETAKRLSTVQKAEKRAREVVAAERAEVARERDTFAAERRAFEAEKAKFDTLAKRVKYDTWGVLKHLGATEDDAESMARTVYAQSKAAAADPKNKAGAEQMARERENEDRVASLEKKLEARDKADQEREERAAQERDVGRYLDDVTKAIGDESPLLKSLLAKNPAKARAVLRETARDLLRETGDTPDAEDVISTYEKQRRAELEELGVDVTTFLSKTTATKKNNQAADEKRPAKTLGTDLNSTTNVPRSGSKSVKEHRAETRRMLEAERLD